MFQIIYYFLPDIFFDLLRVSSALLEFQALNIYGSI